MNASNLKCGHAAFYLSTKPDVRVRRCFICERDEAVAVLKDAGRLIGDMAKFASDMALPDYKAFNEVPIRIRDVVDKAEREEWNSSAAMGAT